MTGRRKTLIAVVAILGLLGLGSGLLPASGAKDPAPAAPDFTGKVVIVSYSRGDQASSAVLEKVQLKRLGERAFLVGVGVDEWSPDRWARGATIWVPVDSVTTLMEVADVEQAKKVFEKGSK